MSTNQTIKSSTLIIGLGLTALWAAGLFGVLEIDSLSLKAVVLLLLAPASIGLDRTVSLFTGKFKMDKGQQSVNNYGALLALAPVEIGKNARPRRQRF